MKKAQYRKSYLFYKYKEIYQVDLDIIKKTIEHCDVEINETNTEIKRKKEKQKGDKLINKINK